jgi:hypothetical protein
MEGVLRSETLVVLSTRMERAQIPLGIQADAPLPAKRSNGSNHHVEARGSAREQNRDAKLALGPEAEHENE